MESMEGVCSVSEILFSIIQTRTPNPQTTASQVLTVSVTARH